MELKDSSRVAGEVGITASAHPEPGLESPAGAVTGAASRTDPGPRARWRRVAVPVEHGGWSLTAEPVLLGLLVAWSWPGLAIGGATMLAFVARTPLKVVLVDRRRGRWLGRTSLAARVFLVETALILLLGVLAWSGAGDGAFLVPLAIALPLIGVELWFDMRSRSRRLVPELAGTIGIGSAAAAIVLASGGAVALATGMWLVVAARAVASVPYARTQVLRTRGSDVLLWPSDLAQLVAGVAVGIGSLIVSVPLATVVAVVAIAGFNVVAVRRPARAAVVIGTQQMLFGVAVVAITATAVIM